MYVWTVDALWPAKTAIIGVYEDPPPEGKMISSIAIDRDSPIGEDFFNDQGIKTALKLTELKDRVRGWLP